MTTLLLSAWGSWSRLQMPTRFAAAAEAAKYYLLHCITFARRGMTNRETSADRQTSTAGSRRCAAQISALTKRIGRLEAVDFPIVKQFCQSFSQATRKLAALHDETMAALHSEGGARAGLARNTSITPPPCLKWHISCLCGSRGG